MPSSKILKVVLDTNMFLSALFFGGMAEIIIDLVLDGKLQLYTSADLSKEVIKKLHYFGADDTTLTKTTVVLDRCTFVTPTVTAIVCRDPKDNFVLELAETAGADYLVTRDRDLLDLKDQQWKQTKIVRPESFLPILRTMKLLN